MAPLPIQAPAPTRTSVGDFLLANRLCHVSGAMSLASAGDGARLNQSAHPVRCARAEKTTGPDVGILVDARAGFREDRPKLTVAVGAQWASTRARNACLKYWPSTPGASESNWLDPSSADPCQALRA
jgi:hypothetical protein